MSQKALHSVEVVAQDGRWLVRVQDESGLSEVSYEIEEYARSFAAGQAIRLGLKPIEVGSGRAAHRLAYVPRSNPNRAAPAGDQA